MKVKYLEDNMDSKFNYKSIEMLVTPWGQTACFKQNCQYCAKFSDDLSNSSV